MSELGNKDVPEVLKVHMHNLNNDLTDSVAFSDLHCST